MAQPMKKAIFLDRDGVVNCNSSHYYVYKEDDFIINEGLMEFMRQGTDMGYIFIVISNQSGIAKGLYTKNDVDTLHDWFNEKLRENGLWIAEFYYCVHHPDYGACLCRKPGSLLIEKALARFNIDPLLSVLFGDQERDVQAAHKVGVRGVKIDANENLMNYLNLIKP
ncbi:MAG: HAD-IIIA family hydrolase [Bacteroidetes bacterium]|jgi:D-glycero-D-manno-heptose 1,7-bisphosphate phosphatase|nr:HAD-IIIA family hydrolase [Bacteroidota bacterium]